MKTLIPRLAAIAGVAAFVAVSTQATPIQLQIQPNSSLTLSGAAFGLPFAAQTPGSLTATYSGTILADLTGGVLTFSGGSSIAALVNPLGPFNYSTNVPAVTEQGNYGVTATGFVTGYGVALINGVYKNLVFDITAGTAQNGLAPAGVTLSLSAGQLDYGLTLNGVPYQAANSSLTGKGGTDTSASLVSFDGTTLSLPVHINTGLYSNRMEDYLGTLVAVVVPEPGAMALVGLGLAALLARRATRRV